MDALLQRVEGEEPQRHLDRAVDGAGHDVVVEEPLQHLLQHLLQPPPLGDSQASNSSPQSAQAVQERTAIERCGALQGLGRAVGGAAREQRRASTSSTSGRSATWPGVGGEAGSGLLGQARAQARERLAQVRARLGLRPVAPEQTRQLVAPLRLAGGQPPGRRAALGPCASGTHARRPRRRSTRSRRAAGAAPDLIARSSDDDLPPGRRHCQRRAPVLSRSCHAAADAPRCRLTPMSQQGSMIRCPTVKHGR